MVIDFVDKSVNCTTSPATMIIENQTVKVYDQTE